jgi:hypothetical protein
MQIAMKKDDVIADRLERGLQKRKAPERGRSFKNGGRSL